MSRIQPPAYTAAKRAKQLERPSSRPSSRQQAHRFQAFDANSDAVELETFLATATAIQTLLGKTAVNEAWRSLRFSAVADDAAPTPQRAASARPTPQRAASARPSYRRPSARLTAEEQQRAAAEAARKQRFAKSCEESSRLLARELDTARMKQRGSRKPGTTWPPEMAMCARLVSKRPSLTFPMHLPEYVVWARRPLGANWPHAHASPMQARRPCKPTAWPPSSRTASGRTAGQPSHGRGVGGVLHEQLQQHQRSRGCGASPPDDGSAS